MRWIFIVSDAIAKRYGLHYSGEACRAVENDMVAFMRQTRKGFKEQTLSFKKESNRFLALESQFGGLQLLNESPRRKKVTPRDLQVPTVTQPCAAENLIPTTPSVQQLISFATPRATKAAGDADSVAKFIASENVQPSTSAASVSVVSASSLVVPSNPIPTVNRRSGPPDIASTARSQIRVTANAVLTSLNTPLNIEAIIERIDFTFNDKRPIHVSEQEVGTLRQGGMSILQYYDEVEKKLTLLTNKAHMTYDISLAKGMCEKFRGDALRVFISGLKRSLTARHFESRIVGVFRCFEATHPPILIDNGLAILENEKIERHIMKNIPGGYNLFVQDKEVATLIENLYVKLKLMLVKKDDAKNNVLLSHLKKINDHLANRNTRFLTGDTMCCFDCELMPRLQHIRVAGKYFVDFEIPTHLTALWRYMYHMYQLDAFWIRPRLPHPFQLIYRSKFPIKISTHSAAAVAVAAPKYTVGCKKDQRATM
ncbi:GL15377 [Drosophila persimilis]|uniref:GL15377 n=1 Tax=Drosophila persimilis TaxID=7234 RepID=B4HBC7_DROPE|nr:GL15377 [Drosophila persimilis]